MILMLPVEEVTSPGACATQCGEACSFVRKVKVALRLLPGPAKVCQRLTSVLDWLEEQHSYPRSLASCHLQRNRGAI